MQKMSRKRKLALALAFEVTGEENAGSQRCLWVHDIIRGRKLYGAYNNLVQELRLDDARFVAYIFLLFLLLWKRQFSLLACHWSAVKKAIDVGRSFQKS